MVFGRRRRLVATTAYAPGPGDGYLLAEALINRAQPDPNIAGYLVAAAWGSF